MIKRIALVVMVFVVMVTTASALNCYGVSDVDVAFYSVDDIKVMVKVINSGASPVVVGSTVMGMILDGRAVNIYRVRLSNVVINREFNTAVGTLPNGRKVYTMPNWLRCE